LAQVEFWAAVPLWRYCSTLHPHVLVAKAMVEIRFDIGSNQTPEDCYVMVRLDGKQKVARISGTQCIHRFPQVTETSNRRVGVVELFRRVGSCEVDLHPSLGSRKVHMQCDELGLQDLCMHIVPDVNVETSDNGTKTHCGTAPKSKKTAQKDAMQQAARDYLAKHQVELQLSKVLRAVLAAKPEDPKKFMAETLLADRATDVLGAVPSDDRVQLSQSPVGSGLAAARHLISPPKKQSCFEKAPCAFKLMPPEAWARIYSRYPERVVASTQLASTTEPSSEHGVPPNSCPPSKSSRRARIQAEDEPQIEIEDVLHLTEEDEVFEANAEEVACFLAQAILSSSNCVQSLPSVKENEKGRPPATTIDGQKPGSGFPAESSSRCKVQFQDEMEMNHSSSENSSLPTTQDELEVEVGNVFHFAEEDERLEIAAEADACTAAQDMFKLAIDPGIM